MQEHRSGRRGSAVSAENLVAWMLVGLVAGMVIGIPAGNVGIAVAIAIAVGAVLSLFVDLPTLLRRSGRD